MEPQREKLPVEGPGGDQTQCQGEQSRDPERKGQWQEPRCKIPQPVGNHQADRKPDKAALVTLQVEPAQSHEPTTYSPQQRQENQRQEVELIKEIHGFRPPMVLEPPPESFQRHPHLDFR